MPADTTHTSSEKQNRLLITVQIVVLAAQLLLTGISYGIYRGIVARTSSLTPSASVSPLRTLDDEINRQHDDAVVRATQSDVKQIGLALLMYAQDYDEKLPPSANDLALSLEPYLNRKSGYMSPTVLTAQHGFDAFVYTFKGSLGPSGTAEKTIVGYKDSAVYGRMNLFLDGHAKLEKPRP